LEIQFFNRSTQKLEAEKVYGEKAVSWLYDSFSGKALLPLVTQRFVSSAYGLIQDTKWSQRKVLPFIRDFSIKMEEFLPEEGASSQAPYSSFNQFFIRRFKSGMRPFVQEPSIMPAFCEARYFGHASIGPETTFPVKGNFLKARDLLGKNFPEFEGGPLLIARLCPVDYHRFHYPDDGKILESYPVHGDFHSVNPLALKKRPDIFIANERAVTIIQSQNFGKLAYIEVGATCVGKIVQTHKGNEAKRGEEKGYFLFGGSTVVLLGEPGRWKPSDDVLEHSQKGIETYLRLGEAVAKCEKSP
jgi:phosphatidylserine decarboxylase